MFTYSRNSHLPFAAGFVTVISWLVVNGCARQANAQGEPVVLKGDASQAVAWNAVVDRYGNGLPKGSGTAERGKVIYREQCEQCHGPRGRGAFAEELVGGIGSLASPYPDRTVGSFWPYAPPLFDYIRRAMPPTAPLSLTNDQVYALVAYILTLNEILEPGQVLDAAVLAGVRMPNRNGFRSSTK